MDIGKDIGKDMLDIVCRSLYQEARTNMKNICRELMKTVNRELTFSDKKAYLRLASDIASKNVSRQMSSLYFNATLGDK